MDGGGRGRFLVVALSLAIGIGGGRMESGNAQEPRLGESGRSQRPKTDERPVVAGHQEADVENEPDLPLNMNLEMPTLGGKQLWTDEWIHGDYRIQRNVLTGHYRLLDDRDLRLAWGTMGQCLSRFEQVRVERQLPPLRGKVVLLLHGLGRSRVAVAALAQHLRKEGGYTTLTMNYASTREGIDRHAQALGKVIQSIRESSEVTELNVVGHSLGNIVLRHYLADCDREPPPKRTPEIRRIVMLGPPNNGAEIARKLHATGLFGVVVGQSGKSLGNEWEDIVGELATPHCEFGIIAGGRGNEKGNNPWLRGDDDLVVTVEETRLVGAADFLLLPALHSGLLKDPVAHAATLRFLREGRFREEGAAEPIRAVVGKGSDKPAREERP